MNVITYDTSEIDERAALKKRAQELCLIIYDKPNVQRAAEAIYHNSLHGGQWHTLSEREKAGYLSDAEAVFTALGSDSDDWQ